MGKETRVVAKALTKAVAKEAAGKVETKEVVEVLIKVEKAAKVMIKARGRKAAEKAKEVLLVVLRPVSVGMRPAVIKEPTVRTPIAL